MPLWPFDYDLAPQLPRSRGTTPVLKGGLNVNVEFNDNQIQGADWYVVQLDMRSPLVA